MRRSRAEKAETNQAIITEASRLMRDRGIEATSVADVMRAAQKTHGGFYRHFDAKQGLVVAALESAFGEMLERVSEGLSHGTSDDPLAQFVSYYLSPAMVADRAGGCPVASLSGEVARSPEDVRSVFGAGVRQMISAIADTLDGSEEERWNRAVKTFSLALGALVIVRAADSETGAKILSAVVDSDRKS